ncbi:FHA domain-containing protein [Rubinisphaera margarita]|uniref:FHA domain-containing protein n=1 Tax=Rubinisphaera margarita TaxID=2909586 RepID=UPI001EE81529|nr:FHA domain-containing protein [Rubinisphaera margarita]MCG6157965.1 FHA domain-containing protein [Rubinisphaera margarita]
MISKTGRTFPLRDGVTIIGRRRGESDLYLNHASVSRKHCLIERSGEKIEIRDLNSRNGVFVNGMNVSNAKLKIDDRIVVGAIALRLVPATSNAELRLSDQEAGKTAYDGASLSGSSAGMATLDASDEELDLVSGNDLSDELLPDQMAWFSYDEDDIEPEPVATPKLPARVRQSELEDDEKPRKQRKRQKRSIEIPPVAGQVLEAIRSPEILKKLVILIVIAVGIGYYMSLPDANAEARKVFVRLVEIHTDMQEMRDSGAPEARWSTFAATVNAELPQLQNNLDTARRDPNKADTYLGLAIRDCLPVMLDQGIDEITPQERQFVDHLQTAREILVGER